MSTNFDNPPLFVPRDLGEALREAQVHADRVSPEQATGVLAQALRVNLEALFTEYGFRLPEQ